MAKGTLELEIHTTRKQIKRSATTEEIIEALKAVIDLPESMIKLQVNLSVDEAPEITIVKYAETAKSELNIKR